jgi:cell division protein ZipA
MDVTTLRILLFVVGLFFLGGIYLYETRRRQRESAQAKRRQTPNRRRQTPKMDNTFERGDGGEQSEVAAEPATAPESLADSSEYTADEKEVTEPLEEEDEAASIESLRIEDEPIPGIDEVVSTRNKHQKEPTLDPEAMTAMDQQELFGFSAREESPVDVQDLIIQINVSARERPFEGLAIEKAMREVGLVLSDMAIYQRFGLDGSKAVLYNVASMVEPGIFPAKEMAGFTTPGLALFAQLPGPGDSLMIFSDMLYTAERLATMLVGDLQDESHSALTKQTIEHLRERIMEQKRQIQLARRKV